MDWKLFWYGVLFLMMLNGYLSTKKEEDDNAFTIMFVKLIYLVGSSFSLYWLITYLLGVIK
jgi:hypothetical protein